MSKTHRKEPFKPRNEGAVAAWMRGGAGKHTLDSDKRAQNKELEELEEQLELLEEEENE